jgi:hypothetical protein
LLVEPGAAVDIAQAQVAAEAVLVVVVVEGEEDKHHTSMTEGAGRMVLVKDEEGEGKLRTDEDEVVDPRLLSWEAPCEMRAVVVGNLDTSEDEARELMKRAVVVDSMDEEHDQEEDGSILVEVEPAAEYQLWIGFEVAAEVRKH